MKASGLGWLGVIVLLALAGYVFYPVGQQIAQGVARGERFQGGRPESYWIEALNCRDQAARNRAVDVLASMGPAVVPHLIKRAEDPRFYGRADAYEALVRMGEPAVPGVVDAAEHDPRSRGIGQPTLARIGAPAVPDLIKMLKENDDAIRAFAAMTLYQMGEPGGDAVPALIEGLKTKEGPKAAAAANSNSSLIQASSNFTLRGMYAGALGKMGAKGKPAVPLLIEMTKEGHNLKSTAVSALGDLGPVAAEAVPTVIDVLKDNGDYIAQSAAARALGRMGPAAKVALPELIKVARDPRAEGALRSAAENAVQLLDPDTAHKLKFDAPNPDAQTAPDSNNK